MDECFLSGELITPIPSHNVVYETVTKGFGNGLQPRMGATIWSAGARVKGSGQARLWLRSGVKVRRLRVRQRSVVSLGPEGTCFNFLWD